MLESQGFGIEILYGEMREDRARWAENEASYTLATSYYTPSKFNTTSPPAGSLMEHLLQQYNAHPDVTRLYNLGASQDGAYDVALEIAAGLQAIQGKGLVNSFHKGDGSTGTLTSPEFKIERKFISFLIGGGGHKGKTCMNLLVDGKVANSATLSGKSSRK